MHVPGYLRVKRRHSPTTSSVTRTRISSAYVSTRLSRNRSTSSKTGNSSSFVDANMEGMPAAVPLFGEALWYTRSRRCYDKAPVEVPLVATNPRRKVYDQANFPLRRVRSSTTCMLNQSYRHVRVEAREAAWRWLLHGRQMLQNTAQPVIGLSYLAPIGYSWDSPCVRLATTRSYLERALMMKEDEVTNKTGPGLLVAAWLSLETGGQIIPLCRKAFFSISSSYLLIRHTTMWSSQKGSCIPPFRATDPIQ